MKNFIIAFLLGCLTMTNCRASGVIPNQDLRAIARTIIAAGLIANSHHEFSYDDSKLVAESDRVAKLLGFQ